MSSLSALDKARGFGRRAESSLLLAALAAAAARLVAALGIPGIALSRSAEAAAAGFWKSA
jgi:hypothetical protein